MQPAEDSGGPWGYAEKLEALTDTAHENNEEALEALGDDHDSHAQPNIAVIHARFAALAKKCARRPRQSQYTTVNAAFRYRKRGAEGMRVAVKVAYVCCSSITTKKK